MATPITSLTKEHTRLLDGSAGAMTIAGADMAPGAFAGVAWQNLTFADCDFTGQGNIKLTSMSGCKFVAVRSRYDQQVARDLHPAGPLVRAGGRKACSRLAGLGQQHRAS
jgi:hypothetical protein